jgi:hypothetical protein
MGNYVVYCGIMCVIGVLCQGAGFMLREKLSPKVAAVLIVIGLALSMIFMNTLLIMQLQNM